MIPAGELEMLIDNIGIPNSWPSHRPGRHPDHLERRRRDPDLAEARSSTVHRANTRSLLRKRLHREVPGHGCSSSSRRTSRTRF